MNTEGDQKQRGRGRFIVIEGLDGAGSSTQVLALHKYIRALRLKCEMTREPSNGPFGAVIREALNMRIPINPRALSLAFAADRADHLDHVTVHPGHNQPEDDGPFTAKWDARNTGIKALLKQGIWVICDRYVISNLAYQSSQGVDLDWLIEINKGILPPDATVLINTPVDECRRRLRYRSTHLELFDKPGQLKDVWERFVRIIALGRKELIGRLIQVDGTLPSAGVTKAIVANLCEYFADELAGRAEEVLDTSDG